MISPPAPPITYVAELNVRHVDAHTLEVVLNVFVFDSLADIFVFQWQKEENKNTSRRAMNSSSFVRAVLAIQLNLTYQCFVAGNKLVSTTVGGGGGEGGQSNKAKKRGRQNVRIQDTLPIYRKY